jgi:hypothetical protein
LKNHEARRKKEIKNVKKQIDKIMPLIFWQVGTLPA